MSFTPTDKKKWLTHLAAVIIFVLVAVIYCKPVLDGMAINQHDLIQWKGMAQDATNYKAVHGTYPQWTNGLFSGMPSYNIAFNSNAYLPTYIIKAMSLGLPEPISYFFLACVCFYFLSQVIRVNPWIGVLGAIGFAYCSYDPIIIAVGHHTKMITMALMPALLGALIMLYEKKYWLGGSLVAAFTAALVVNNHLQIIYYMLIVVLFMTVAYAIRWIKAGEIRHMMIAGSIAIGAAGLGALTSAVNLFTTYDYSKESMRGGKSLLVLGDSTGTPAGQTSGLDAEYAFRWSYGIPESLNMLVPNLQGGASESLGEDSKFYESLMEAFQTKQLDEPTAQQVSRVGAKYWGDQPFTSGPVYLGAIIILLMIVGLALPNNKHAWWALAAIVLSLLMAWGSNLAGFNNFLFEHLPLYNKFRAPSMVLVIPQLLAPFLGILGLQALLMSSLTAEAKWKTLKGAGFITGGLFVVALLFYFTADYTSSSESDMVKSLVQAKPEMATAVKTVVSAAAEDRKSLLMNDWIRSLAFAGAAFVVLWSATRKKLGLPIALGALLILTTFDLLAVGKRYLNESNFEPKEDLEATSYVAASNPPLYQALAGIQKDTDPHYRVFNVAGDSFNDALTSAFVRSVGGYHPAKLSIYQDLIQYQLSSGQPNMQVLNMLDTRYFILPGQNGPQVQQNPYAYGPAWLAKHVQVVPDAASEMKALESTNLLDTAVVQAQYQADIAQAPLWDSTASIQLVKYDNQNIEYSVKAPNPQFAVLSEIYYSRGWNAYADGKAVPIVKTDYVLRGVALPAGTSKLELKFEPKSYQLGYTVTNITSLLILLVLALGIYMEFFSKKKKEAIT